MATTYKQDPPRAYPEALYYKGTHKRGRDITRFGAAFRDMNLFYAGYRYYDDHYSFHIPPTKGWGVEQNKANLSAYYAPHVKAYPRLLSARSRQEQDRVKDIVRRSVADREVLHDMGFFESLMFYLPVGMTSPENWVPLSRAFRLGMTGSRAGAFKVAAGTGGRAVTEVEKAALIAAHRTHPAIVSAAHIGDDMTHGLAQNLLQRVALSKTTIGQAALATGLEGMIAGAVSEMVLQKTQPLRTMEETWMSIVGGGVFGAVLGGGFYAIGKTYRGALTSLLGQEVAGDVAVALRGELGNTLNEVVEAGATGWIRKSDRKAMDEGFTPPDGHRDEYDYVEVAPGADTRAAADEAVTRVVDEENAARAAEEEDAARAADDDDAPTELAQAEEVAPRESATEVATSDAAIASPAEVLISKRMHEALLRLDADTNTVSSKVARLVGLAEGNTFWGRLVGRWLLWSPNTRMGQEITDYGRQMYQLFSGGALTQEAGSRGHGVNRPGADAASQYMEVMNLRLVGELAKLAREVTASSGVSEIDLRSLAHSYAVRSYEDDGVTPRALDLADEFHESSGLEGAERSVYDIINKIEDPTARQAAVDGVERAVKEIYDPFIENTGKLLRSMGLLKLDSSQTRRMAAMYVARMYDATKIRKHYDAFFASVRAGIEEWKASDEPSLVASIEVQRQLVADPGSTASDAAHLVVLEQRLADLIGIDDARIHAVIRNIINDPINSDMASSRMGPQNSLHERVLLLRDEFVEPFLVKDIGLVMQTITKRHIPKVAIYRYLASPVQLELMQRTLDQYEAFDDIMKALRDPATGKIPDNLPRAEVEKVTKAMNDLFQSTNLLRLHNGLRLLSVFKPEVAGQAVEANGQAVDMVGITNRIKDLLQEHRDASDTAHNQQVVADGFEEKLLSLEQDIQDSMRDAIGGTTPAESVLDAATLRQHRGSLIVQMLDDMVARVDSDEIRDAGAEVQAAVSTLTAFGDEGERALRGEAFLNGLKADIRETVEREFAAVVESSRTPDNNNQGGDVSTRVANMGPAAWVLHLARNIHDPEKLISEGWASREMIDLVESKFLKGGTAEAGGASVTKGVFQLDPHGLKDVIKGFSGADFSTAVHEIGHALRLRTLTRAKITDGHAGDVTHQDMDDLELWANDGRALDPLAEGKDRVWTTDMEEKFARAFEQYVAEGKFQPGVSAGVKRVMEELMKAMKRVYQAFAGRFSTPLDPRVKTVFDKLLLSDEDIVAAAARETNNSPHRRLTESQKTDIKRVFHLSDSEADGIYELYDALNLDKGMIVFKDSSEVAPGGLEQRTEGKGEFLADNKVDLAGWVDEFTNHPDWKERYGEEVIEGRIRTSGFRVESTAGVLFRDGLIETATTHRFGKAVEVKDQAFYLDPEARIYLARDATAGLVVTPDRDLISVHKMPGSAADINGLLSQASKFAETLDGFDINGHLPTLYGRHGWRPVARAEFNPDFRPEGWDMRPIDEGGLGTPDIVLMVYDPTDALRLPHADSFNEVRDQVPFLSMDKYDDAVALQTQAKELIRESVGGRTGDELDIQAKQYFQTESEVPRIEGEDHGSLAARAVHSPDNLLRVFGTPDNIEGTGTHPRSSLPNTPVRDLFWRTGRVEDDLEGTRGEVVHPNFPGTTEEFGLPTTAGALREAGYKGADKEKIEHWHETTYATKPDEQRKKSFSVEDSMKLQDEILVPHEKVLRYIDGVDEEQVQVSAMGYAPLVARKIHNEQAISYGEITRLIDNRLDFLMFQGLHSQREEIEGYLQWAIRQHPNGKPFLVGDDISLGVRGNGGEAVHPESFINAHSITRNNGIAITDENLLRADLDHEVFRKDYIEQAMSDFDYVIKQVGEGMSEIDSVATVKVLNDLKVEVRAVLENTPKVQGGLLSSLASDMSNSLIYNRTRESRVYKASRDLAAKKKSGAPLTDAESARDVWSRSVYKESGAKVRPEIGEPPQGPLENLPWYNLTGLIEKQSWKGHEEGGLVARAIMDLIGDGYHNPESLDIRLGQFEDNVRLSKIWAKQDALFNLELEINKTDPLLTKSARKKGEAAVRKAWKEWGAKFHKEQWEPVFGKGSRVDPHGFGTVKTGPDHHGSTLREWEHDGGLIDLENIRDIVPGLLEEYGQYQAQLKSALRVLYPSGLIPVARWRDFLSNARSAEHDFRYSTAGTRSPDTAISLKAKQGAMLSMGDRSMLSATIQHPEAFHKTTIGAPPPYGVRGAPEGSATHDVAYHETQNMVLTNEGDKIMKVTKGRKVLKEVRKDGDTFEQPSDAWMAKTEGTQPGVAVHEIVHIDDILFMGAAREGEVHVKRNALLYNKHRTVADLYQTSEVIQKIMDEVESLIDGKKVTPNAAVAKVLVRLGWAVPMGQATQTGLKQVSPRQLKSMLLALQANSKRMLFHDKADEAARFWYEDSSAGILEAFQGDLLQASMFIDVLAITSANTNPKQNLGNALDTVAKIMNLPNLKSGVTNLFPSHAFPLTLKPKLEKIVLGYDAAGRAVRLGDQDWSIRLSSGKRNAFKTASFARTIHRALQYDIFREEMQGHWQSELHDVVADVWMFRHFQFGKTGAQDTPAKFNERLRRFQTHMETLGAKGDSKELRKARNAERKSKKHLNYSDSTRSLDSGKDYKFMTDMIEMLTDELNEDAYRGATDWKPWQVQAMLWTTHRFIEAGESDPMVYHNLLEEGYPWRANHPFTPGPSSTHLNGLEALPDNIRVQIAALRNRATSDFQTDSYVIATNKGDTGHATLDLALKEVGGEAHARSTEAVRRVVSEEAKVIRVDGAVTPKGNRGHATQVVELRTGNDDRLRAAGARMGLAGGHDNVLTFRVRQSGKQALQIVEFDESLSATQIKNLLKRHKMGKHSITKGEGDGYRVFIYDDTYGKGAQLRSPVLMKVREWVSNGKIKKHEEVRGTAERVGADDGSSKEVIAASYRDTLRGVDERGSEAHKALGTSVPYSYSLVRATGSSARSGHNAPGADAVLLELGLPGLSSVTPGVTGTTRLFLPNQVIPAAVRREAEEWITKTNLEQGGKPISKAIIKALAGVLNDGVHTVNAGNQWAAATAALYRLDSITWSRIVPPDLTNSKLHNGYTLMLPEGAVWDRDSLADLRAHFETLGPLAKRLRFEQQSPEGLGIYITTERGGLNWFPDSKTGSGQQRTEIDANLFPRLHEATLTVKRSLAEWNKGRPEAGMVEYEGFTYVGNRLENDWSVNPNGEGYLDAPWKGPGGKAVKARVQAVVRKLLPRMDAADEVAAARYGLQVNPELLKSYRTPDHSSSIEAGRGTNTFSRGASDPSVRGREPEYFQHNERRQINSDLEALGLGGLFDSETIAGNRPEIEAALGKIREGRARIEAATRAAGGETDPNQMLESLISEAIGRAEQTGDLPEIPGFPKLTQGVQDLMAARGQEGAVRAARGALDEADPGGAPARTEVAGAQGGLRAARHGVARAESEFDSATQELRAISADLGVPTDASSRGRPADGYEPHSYAYPKRRGSSGEEMEAMAGRARAATEQVRSETSGDALSLEPHLAVIRRAYEKKVAAARTAGNDAEVKRLEKRFHQTAMDLQAMKDRILNTHGINTDAVGYGMRLAKAAKDFNYIRFMGGVTLSSIPDLAMGISVAGLRPYLTAWAKMLKAEILNDDVARADIAKLIYAAETVLGEERVRKLYFLDDNPMQIEQTKAEKGLEWSARKFGKWSGIQYWNAVNKAVAATAIQSRVIEISRKVRAGTASAFELEMLGQFGIDTEMATLVARVHGVVGETGVDLFGGDFYHSRVDLWDGPIDGLRADEVAFLKEQYYMAIMQAVNRTIVTPNAGDLPLIATSSAIGKLLFQFKSFSFAATNSVLISGLQRGLEYGDISQVILLAGLSSLGGFVYAGKEWLGGRDPFRYENDISKFIVEGMDRGGGLGILSETNAIFEKTFGLGLSQFADSGPLSRYSSRNKMDALMGPTFGTAKDMLTIAGSFPKMFTADDVSGYEIDAARRMFAFQNLIQTRLALDVGPSLIQGGDDFFANFKPLHRRMAGVAGIGEE